MDDNQSWHIIDYLFTAISATLGFFMKNLHGKLEKTTADHALLKDHLSENYIRKDDFIRAVDNMDRNFELINRKLDLLFIPKADK